MFEKRPILIEKFLKKEKISIDFCTLLCYYVKAIKRNAEVIIMDTYHNEGYELLIKAIMSLKTEEECANFLEDLMTRKEISDAAQRMLVAKMLSEQIVYSKIASETGASTATISRVNRSYLYGAGGYRAVLEKIENEYKN